jgi:4-(gamma-glutamylamino)butanal dehydrogenase
MNAKQAINLEREITYPTGAFIDGRYREATSNATLGTFNPSSGALIVEVASCDAEDVDEAVSVARRKFDDGDWSRRTPTERKRILLDYAELLDAHSEDLARLDALDAGKPITDCRSIDIPEGIEALRWYAEYVDKNYGAVAPTSSEQLGLILPEPVGVVGAVLPWNFPAFILLLKVAPALAAGNSVVIKPSELSPLSALRMAELAVEAGIPAGVFNVVPGLGEVAGRALGVNCDVDVVSFTGSTEVGRLFLQYSAASNMKRIVLECGGKSPQIVFGDAPDLDVVAEEVVTSGYWNMGENCSAGSRLLVQRSIKEDLLARVIERSSAWQVGDALDEETRIGPMIELAHLEKVLNYVDSGLHEGANLVVGGTRLLENSGGFFIGPTIFDGVSNEMRIAREEIFGPVISVIEFESVEEAIAIANDTSYGLAASVYTRNIDTALRVARAIKAGTVSVNCYSEGGITTPFGGYKQSGFGGRDMGREAFEQYSEVKTVWIQMR